MELLGLILHPRAVVLDPHADGRKAVNVVGPEGAQRGRPHTSVLLVVHTQTNFHTQGPVPRLTLIRDTAGAQAIHVLDP